MIEGQLQESPAEGLIVAINEGRLRRLFRSLSAEAQGLWKAIVEPALEGWLDSERAKALDAAMLRERVLVVNFRHRFHVRTVTPDLLATWTPQSLWEQSPACGACPALPANHTAKHLPVTDEDEKRCGWSRPTANHTSGRRPAKNGTPMEAGKGFPKPVPPVVQKGSYTAAASG
jgi:hypothetical protein